MLFPPLTSVRGWLRPSLARYRIRRLRPRSTGWPLIRLGAPNDGGYLVPDDLDGIVACFSPGVAGVCDFELDMAQRGVPVFMADASVKGPPKSHPLFRFEPLFLRAATGGDTVSLDDWVARHAPAAGDMLLQMDIEGAEYEVLAAASPETLRRFRVIVLEVHRLQNLFAVRGHQGVMALFDDLLRDFIIVHAHANNHAAPTVEREVAISRVIEFTFHRRDRVRPGGDRVRLPHTLDAPNLTDRPDYPLSELWWR